MVEARNFEYNSASRLAPAAYAVVYVPPATD